MTTKLNLGCGNNILKNYTNIDQFNNLKGVDIKCNIRELPYDDSSVDEILISHVMEHFSFDDVQIVFKEMSRVLKIDGILEIYVPDFISCIDKWNNAEDDWSSLEWIFGSQSHPGNFHLCGYTIESMKKIVEDFNFEIVENKLRNNPVSNDVEIKCVSRKVGDIKKNNIRFNFSMEDGPRLEIKGESNYDFRVEFWDAENDTQVHSTILRSNCWTTSKRNDFNKLNIKVLQFGKILFDLNINK